MASSDLEQYFTIIRTASRGEAVRDAIINAAKNIRGAANNSKTLGGIDYSLFATRTEYDKLVTELYRKINYDSAADLENDTYALNSENVMTSGNMYDILQSYLRPALSTIMHYESDPLAEKETKKAVELYLTYLLTAKEEMYAAIKAKTKPQWQNHDFRDFEYMIQHITDQVPELDSGRFTKDGEYDAGANTVEYRAYETIDVNVPDSELKVQGSTSENNSTHTPPEGKLYSSFNVNVPNASSARTSTVSGRSGGSGGTQVDENGLMEKKDIDQNGTYSASGDAVSGYKLVSVHVKEKDANGTYKVRFLNGDDVLSEQDVPAYGSAYYDGSELTNPNDASDETEFYGWSPVPLRVTMDMDCQAQFRVPNPNPDPLEITDSWEDIVGCRGDKYDIGSYKSLNIGSVSGSNYGNLIFQKVGNGTSNATSVWISKTLLNLSSANHSWGPWPTCGVRKFLNNDFIDVLSATSDGELIADNVVPMQLVTMAPWTNWPNINITSEYYRTFCEYKTIDEFWVPSIFEMAGNKHFYTNDPDVDGYKKIIKIHLNERRTYSDPEVGLLPTSSWVEPFVPYIWGYEWHADSATDYSGAYGGTDIAMDQDRRQYDITAKVPGNYIKYRSTNTSQAADYTLRTICRYGNHNASTTLIHNYWRVGSTGGIGQGQTSQYYPIGFGL